MKVRIKRIEMWNISREDGEEPNIDDFRDSMMDTLQDSLGIPAETSDMKFYFDPEAVELMEIEEVV